jgi:hypothetical protein
MTAIFSPRKRMLQQEVGQVLAEPRLFERQLSLLCRDRARPRRDQASGRGWLGRRWGERHLDLVREKPRDVGAEVRGDHGERLKDVKSVLELYLRRKLCLNLDVRVRAGDPALPGCDYRLRFEAFSETDRIEVGKFAIPRFLDLELGGYR